MPKHRFPKLVVLFSMLAATSGCGEIASWLGGTYYGPPESNQADGTALWEEGSAGESPAESQKVPQDYATAMDNMDQVYGELTARLPREQQLNLSHEQTVWLNTRDRGCNRTGADSDHCKFIMTQTRTAVLSERLRALGKWAPPGGVAAPVVVQRSATLNVAATAMPWIWKTGGINAPFEFGYPDGTPPAAVKLARLGAKPGGHLTIRYVTGRITLGPGTPATDALGYSGLRDQSEVGPAGKYPSAYMQPGAASLGALVGVFTKADGSIVGAPFGVGDGPATVPIPPGAERLQLGINDDIYGAGNPGSSNSGALTVNVSAD